MRKIILVIGVLAGIAATHVTTQNSEGVITYETKINMHRNLPADRQEMKEMMPEFRTSIDLLFFNAEESLYRPMEEEHEPGTENDGMHIRMQRPKNEVYIQTRNLRRVMLQEFMGKKYLIEDSLRLRPWKITTEMKEINGYTCRKATLFDEDRKINVVAWYSDQFRPFLGPENFNSLPGAVLLVDINDGERSITARKVELRPLSKNEIVIPSAKTKVSEKEFRDIMKEQMDRMRSNGRNVIIRN